MSINIFSTNQEQVKKITFKLLNFKLLLRKTLAQGANIDYDCLFLKFCNSLNIQNHFELIYHNANCIILSLITDRTR